MKHQGLLSSSPSEPTADFVNEADLEFLWLLTLISFHSVAALPPPLRKASGFPQRYF